LNAKEASEYIQHLEEKYDLLQHQIDSWSVWPFMRFLAMATIRQMPENKSAKKDQWGVSDQLSLAIKDIPQLLSIPKARYAIKTYDMALREESGLYRDTYFDDFLADVGNYFKIEGMSKKHFMPQSQSAFIKRNITANTFKVLAHIPTELGLPPHISNVAGSLASQLEQEPGLKSFTHTRIAKMMRRFFWRKKLYRWLFSRIQPEYLLLINAYGEHPSVAAAKEQGLKVVEFQHGSLNRHHIGYSWSTYALYYKTKMPIPDQIFLYGDYWKQELMVNGFWQEEDLQSVGSLRVDQFRQKRINKNDASYTIVLTTQHLDTKRLIAFMADFLRLAKGKLNLQLYIKLHPGELDAKPYQDVFETEPRVHIVAGNEAPSTFDLLSLAHAHLSMYSTCHYEALALGTPTIILPLAGHEVALHLYEAGHASLAKTPQDLLDIILKQKPQNAPAESGAFYFKPNALHNVKQKLGL